MNPTLKVFLKHYFGGLLASSWNAGWAAVAGILGIDGLSVTGLSEHAHVLHWHEMAAAFAGAFVLNAVLWIKSHPLPETWQSTPPIPPKP